MTTDQETAAPQPRGPRPPQVRRPRLRGEERDQVRADVAKGYKKPKASIRSLAADFDLSFGLTRTLLQEAGVTLRGRRGDRDNRTADAK
ncbi:helix-turn-helix domain-containing protein [Actinacidiphila sp. ITFR-21]|uniref:helix-turn-helix domain-containing protein n=1 Tax=Actinacidiphila sp. ITFR-21 TaxID=3075199 RepID=UPI00288AA812|nr:helix-turn-helix domain-containing protein [Streptomyces sp. ITFR-21]WNI20328.1 helix-turn-helix domain-containing protein [Streptomyces sp. ITFR-21]